MRIEDRSEDSNWRNLKISWLFEDVSSGTTPSSTNDEYYNDGEIPWVNTGDLTDGKLCSVSKNISRKAIADYPSLKVHPKDSLIVALYGATIGKLAITQFNVTTNQACCVLNKPRSIDIDFAFYWFLANREGIIQRSVGGGQKNISQGIIRSLRIDVPGLTIQNKIVSFLNQKTSEIDGLISDKEKLIKLLEEKRQAVITEAVTKGLDSDVKMKDSGVEWIGEIPEHWDSIQIKWLTSVKRGASPRPIDDPKYFDEFGEFGWVRISDVTKSNKYLINTEQKLSKLGSDKSVKLKKGDLFLSIAGSVGKPCITNISCCIHDGFVYFPEYKESIDYLYYIFETKKPYQGLGKLGTQLNLNTDTVGKIKIPLPAKETQERIVDYIKKRTSEIDELLTQNNDSVNLLRQYRQALIYEAVTGKIDVQEMVKETEQEEVSSS